LGAIHIDIVTALDERAIAADSSMLVTRYGEIGRKAGEAMGKNIALPSRATASRTGLPLPASSKSQFTHECHGLQLSSLLCHGPPTTAMRKSTVLKPAARTRWPWCTSGSLRNMSRPRNRWPAISPTPTAGRRHRQAAREDRSQAQTAREEADAEHD
jgi:hypothetical protein